MLAEVGVGLVLSPADAADVRLGGDRNSSSLHLVHGLPFPALVKDPLGEMEEGVAVGVGGDIDDGAEERGELLEREGGLVRGTAGGLVVEIPENHDFCVAVFAPPFQRGGPDAVSPLHHLHGGRGKGVLWTDLGRHAGRSERDGRR